MVSTNCGSVFVILKIKVILVGAYSGVLCYKLLLVTCHILEDFSAYWNRSFTTIEGCNYWSLTSLCRFYFDFSPTYVGCGLICSHIVNCSVLFGAIISWGLLWPFISQHAGDWYPADLGSNDFKGLYGYKVLSRFFPCWNQILVINCIIYWNIQFSVYRTVYILSRW